MEGTWLIWWLSAFRCWIFCQLHIRRPRYRYAVRSGDDNPMLRTGDRSVPNLTTLTTFGYGSKMIKNDQKPGIVWFLLPLLWMDVHPLNIWVFYDGLHACRCRCRWSLCTAKGAIPCAASSRVPGCGWFFLSGTVPMDPQLLQVIQSCETIWGCIKTNLAIFGGMNIHLPVIWGSLGYQGFDSYPFMKQICPRKNRL